MSCQYNAWPDQAKPTVANSPSTRPRASRTAFSCSVCGPSAPDSTHSSTSPRSAGMLSRMYLVTSISWLSATFARQCLRNRGIPERWISCAQFPFSQNSQYCTLPTQNTFWMPRGSLSRYADLICLSTVSLRSSIRSRRTLFQSLVSMMSGRI